jgi:hypothetical protein
VAVKAPGIRSHAFRCQTQERSLPKRSHRPSRESRYPAISKRVCSTDVTLTRSAADADVPHGPTKPSSLRWRQASFKQATPALVVSE